MRIRRPSALEKRERIPVDNMEFSTLSTVFSTGLFHREGSLWKSVAD